MEQLVDIFSLPKGHKATKQQYLTPPKAIQQTMSSLLPVYSSLLRRDSSSNLQPNREYMGIFEDYINDSQYWPSSKQKLRRYSLIEDIAILYFVSSANSHDKINLMFWDYLVSANIFQRNAASLKDRYV
jgi:hypothetical protein